MTIEALFHRIADQFPGTVEALELRANYAQLRFNAASQDEGGGYYVTERRAPPVVEIFPYEARSPEGADVPLVRIQLKGDDPSPVLVSPLPSAIIALAMR
jgi:hypothetical protein